MRGRKPKPTVLKVLRGNPGRRPLNQQEPTPAVLETALPPELVDATAQEEWTRTIVPAIKTGQITEQDRSIAIAHCELWATWRSQVTEAARHAHIIAAGPNNYPTPNPARMMANKTFQLLVRVDAELGFTPSSRARVKVGSSDEAGRDDDRFFGRRA